MDNKWIERFLQQAYSISKWSKDPSTKVGAIAVDDDRKIIGVGYNGLPRNMPDLETILHNREEKYRYILHAEENCMYNAIKDTKNCTVFITHSPCEHCLSVLKQHGVKAVYSPRNVYFEERYPYDRVKDSCKLIGIKHHTYGTYNDLVVQDNCVSEYETEIFDWVVDTFGHEYFLDKAERLDRFMEEVAELMQAEGVNKDRLHKAIDYVYSRKPDIPVNEVGGVAITFLSYLKCKSITEFHKDKAYDFSQVVFNELERVKDIPKEKMKKSQNRKYNKGLGRKV